MSKDEFVKRIVNATPHPITFRWDDGEDVIINPSGYKIDAGIKEQEIKNEDGISYVKTIFIKTEKGIAEIEEIKSANPNAIIVGSIISAQAYAGQVVGLTNAPGFERVPPAEKRMNPFKFTIF